MAVLKTMVVKGDDGNELAVGVLGPGGNPIYEIEGKEVELDAAVLRSDLSKLNQEDAGWRHKYRELEAKMAAYADIDPDRAKEALATVANLKDKELIDAKQVETMKQQWESSFLQNKAASDDAFQAKIAELSESLEREKTNIKKEKIQRIFSDSKFLENTTFDKLRDAAYMMFGNRFEVEQGDNGDYRVVAKNPDGTQILSVARPGQPATMDEAMEHIILTHPQKDYILRGSQASGSGAQGGTGGGSKSTMQQLMDKHAAAIKANNFSLAMSLKDQMSEMQREGGAS